MTHLTAAYMAIGLFTSPNALQVQDKWGEGQFDLIATVTGFADFSYRLSQAGLSCSGGVPGIVEQDVAEWFGSWFGEQILDHEIGPLDEACHQWLRLKMYDFYKFDLDETRSAELARALAAVEIEVTA